MLSARALPRWGPALVRFSSETRSQVQQSILADIQANVAGKTTLNPITAPSLVKDLGPPRAGPEGYTSPENNPWSSTNIDSYRPSGNWFRFDCHSTRNNTIITVSSLKFSNNHPQDPPTSNTLAWYSGGTVGFKKGNRGGYEAGYQCAVRAFKLLEKLKKDNGGEVSVHLYFKGFGQGREALKTALTTSEGDQVRDVIKSITDRTALKIGGTRSKKTRRL